jgi:hypothetical protein
MMPMRLSIGSFNKMGSFDICLKHYLRRSMKNLPIKKVMMTSLALEVNTVTLMKQKARTIEILWLKGMRISSLV